MEIIFTRATFVQGKAYKAGATAEIPSNLANQLIAMGKAKQPTAKKPTAKKPGEKDA